MAALRVSSLLLVLLVAASFAASAVADPAEAFGVYDPEVNSLESDPFMDKFLEHNVDNAGTYDTLGGADDFGTSAAPPRGRTIVVDKNGKGNYKKVQQAVNSVPNGNTKRIIIFIKNGVYREKIRIPKEKAYIYFKCESKKTILVWGDTAEKAGGTSLSASTAVESKGFIASDCTFSNSAPAPPGGAVGKQAVALRIQGDMGAFYRCAFLGAQDTLYDKEGRHFFRSCYIRGSIDYIFGTGQSFYQSCHIQSIADKNSGSITAHKRSSNDMTGFVFYKCLIDGTGTIYMGRAWGTHSRVIYNQCHIANMIRPEAWQDWNDPKRQKTVYYAEYKCTGPGANRKGRVKWSRVLTAKEAVPFSSVSYINGQKWFEPAM